MPETVQGSAWPEFLTEVSLADSLNDQFNQILAATNGRRDRSLLIRRPRQSPLDMRIRLARRASPRHPAVLGFWLEPLPGFRSMLLGQIVQRVCTNRVQTCRSKEGLARWRRNVVVATDHAGELVSRPHEYKVSSCRHGQEVPVRPVAKKCRRRWFAAASAGRC